MIRPVQTRLFAVIGRPIKHSLSPVMMNEAFKALGIPAVYVALELTEFILDMEHISAVGFEGLSVTLPYKGVARDIAVVDDEAVHTIKAVNCLKKASRLCSPNGRRWRGINTDWVGVVETFRRQGIDMGGRKALVIGAGGAAMAVIYAALKMGAEVTIVNRTDDKAFDLAKTFGVSAVEHDVLMERGEKFDVVFQATPVGMEGYGGEHIISYDIFEPGMIAMDIVYKPLKTDFLKAAEERGCSIILGIDMLLYQGVAQFEWWFDTPAPVEVMRSALYRAVERDDV